MLAGTEYADAVEADVAGAGAYGATGVPFFVVDERYGVSGAQPEGVFAQVLERAWADRTPTIAVVGEEAEVCGPEGCEAPASR